MSEKYNGEGLSQEVPGRYAFVLSILLLLVAIALGVFVLGGSSVWPAAGSRLDRAVSLCFWSILLAFLASIPVSLGLLAWCIVLLFRRTKLGCDRLSGALVTLLAYFILAGFLVYLFFADLPSGGTFH